MRPVKIQTTGKISEKRKKKQPKPARKQDQHEQHPNQEKVNTVFESITHKDTQTKSQFLDKKQIQQHPRHGNCSRWYICLHEYVRLQVSVSIKHMGIYYIK